MKRKLILLNAALLVLAAAAIWQLRSRYAESRAREQRILQPPEKPVSPGPPRVLAPPEPATPARYNEVAQKTLFSADRNPDVIVEEPPPKPVPPFPVAYGMMNLGSTATAILSEKPGAPNRGYKAGDKIGEFTLAAVEKDELVFEWEGQQFRKKLRELKPQTNAPPPGAAAEAAAEGAGRQSEAPVVASVQTAASVAEEGPGRDTGDGFRACVAGDKTPAGTVKDGFRKVVYTTPFGQTCRWEPVK